MVAVGFLVVVAVWLGGGWLWHALLALHGHHE
jgi:hypothetical protein